MKDLFISGDILLPKNQDMSLWSVIACDQYTSNPEYWDDVAKRVGDKPSTLKLMLPEAYIDIKDTDAETKKINATMEQYLQDGIFETIKDSYIYVERDMSVGQKRCGLVGLIDLEEYDYRAGSKTLVRPTEGTVESRLPPRVKVREGAYLEMPHIVVFVDDSDNTVFTDFSDGEKLYEFELMDGGGHITGRRVHGDKATKVKEALAKLSDPEYINKKYGIKTSSPVVIAMGDGNHSLATARKCWEKLRETLTPEERENHPARYSLVELVNIHDKSIIFEPIHRVIFDTDNSAFADEAKKYFANIKGESSGVHEVSCVCNGVTEKIKVKGLQIGQVIAQAQKFCLSYMEKHGGKLDYIHDDDTAIDMSNRKNSCGLLLPAMSKNELYPSIMKSGAFPAKSFSIGPSRDKRYYLECKRIK